MIAVFRWLKLLQWKAKWILLSFNKVTITQINIGKDKYDFFPLMVTPTKYLYILLFALFYYNLFGHEIHYLYNYLNSKILVSLLKIFTSLYSSEKVLKCCESFPKTLINSIQMFILSVTYVQMTLCFGVIWITLSVF